MPKKMKACYSLCFKLWFCNFIDQESFPSLRSLSNMKHLLSSKTKAKFGYHWISYRLPKHLSHHRAADEKWSCPFSSQHCYTQRTGSVLCSYTQCNPLPCLQCDSSYPCPSHLPCSQNIYFSYSHLAPLLEILLWQFAVHGLDAAEFWKTVTSPHIWRTYKS